VEEDRDMVITERLQEIKARFQFYKYPEPLVEAICNYLAEEGSLKAVEREWQAAMLLKQPAFPELIIRGWLNPHTMRYWGSPHGELSEFELRLISVCAVTGQFWGLLRWFASPETLFQALQRLHSQDIEAHRLLEGMFHFLRLAVDAQGNLNTLGRFLLQFLPDQFETLFPPPPADPPHLARYVNAQALVLIQLLLETTPPQVDLAWQVIQQVNHGLGPGLNDGLGHCIRLMLRVAPERFTTWARAVASPDSSASPELRKLALQALMEHDPARHVDLAVAAVRADFPPYNWEGYQLRQAGLDAAYRFDPVQYLPLVEESSLSESPWLAEHALQLLIQSPTEQARPALQQCVAESGIAVASRALKALLSQQWEGCQEYTLSLLAHRAKRIRSEASAWLAQQGEAVIAGVVPFLTHADPAVRLTAIDTLAAIGGERALATLAARLEAEKTPRVRQAIFAVVGLPADQQHPGPLTRATLLATAEATLRYASKPAPRWFVASQVPAPLWANNEPVPSNVLLYLLYRQSFVKAPGALDNEVSQALALLNRSTTGSMASYLFRGWVEHSNTPKEAWCIPLICALGDDTLIPALSLRVEDWYRDNRRKLAIAIIQSLPLFGSQAAIAELRSLAKRLRRGIVKTAAQDTLAAVAP
jgi:hypothetical protein